MKHRLLRVGLLSILIAVFTFSLGGRAFAQSAMAFHTDNLGHSLDGPAITKCVSLGVSGQAIWKTWTDSSSHTIYLEEISLQGNVIGSWATAQSSYSAPAIACPANNYPILAWRANDPSNSLHVGFVAESGSGVALSNNVISASTGAAPALASDGNGTIYLGWVGTDSQHHLNLLTSLDDGRNFQNVVTFTDYTFNGGGLGMTYAGFTSTLYFTWIASSGAHNIWFGSYKGANQLQDTTLSDTSPSHAGISASGNVVLFIWRGDTNNNIYTARWTYGGYYDGSHPQVDTTYYAPAVLALDNGGTQTATAFTGTDSAVDFDYGAYGY